MLCIVLVYTYDLRCKISLANVKNMLNNMVPPLL